MDNKIVSVLKKCLVIYEIRTIEFNSRVGSTIVTLACQLLCWLVLMGIAIAMPKIFQIYKKLIFFPK